MHEKKIEFVYHSGVIWEGEMKFISRKWVQIRDIDNIHRVVYSKIVINKLKSNKLVSTLTSPLSL